MSRKERRRLVVLEQVQAGYVTLREASERLHLSYRQTGRLFRQLKRGGASGLIHGNRGMPSNREHDPAFKERVLELYAMHYREYGPTLAAEVLAEEHGVKVHPETLRRWLHGASLYVSKQRLRQHRKHRERRRRFGELVQIDGSDHAWLGGEHTCLMVAVDDATGRTLAHMGRQETTADAYALLLKWILRYGVPEAIYVDRRSIYWLPRDATAEEVRQGSGPLTDFCRACWRLDIEVIFARSPEAKGRVERKNGVLQDRFVKFLERRGIRDIAGANAVVDGFLADLNQKQAKEPANPVDAHRKRPTMEQLRELLCWEEERTVQRDWTVSHQGQLYQIEPQPGQPAPRDRITVRRRLDNSLNLLHRGRPLRWRPVARE
jgi:transposase